MMRFSFRVRCVLVAGGMALLLAVAYVQAGTSRLTAATPVEADPFSRPPRAEVFRRLHEGGAASSARLSPVSGDGSGGSSRRGVGPVLNKSYKPAGAPTGSLPSLAVTPRSGSSLYDRTPARGGLDDGSLSTESVMSTRALSGSESPLSTVDDDTPAPAVVLPRLPLSKAPHAAPKEVYVKPAVVDTTDRLPYPAATGRSTDTMSSLSPVEKIVMTSRSLAERGLTSRAVVGVINPYKVFDGLRLPQRVPADEGPSVERMSHMTFDNRTGKNLVIKIEMSTSVNHEDWPVGALTHAGLPRSLVYYYYLAYDNAVMIKVPNIYNVRLTVASVPVQQRRPRLAAVGLPEDEAFAPDDLAVLRAGMPTFVMRFVDAWFNSKVVKEEIGGWVVMDDIRDAAAKPRVETYMPFHMADLLIESINSLITTHQVRSADEEEIPYYGMFVFRGSDVTSSAAHHLKYFTRNKKSIQLSDTPYPGDHDPAFKSVIDPLGTGRAEGPSGMFPRLGR